MLWTVVIVLLVLWAVGFFGSFTMGGLIHILLVVALITLIIRLLQGKKIIS
ncbi:MAG: lmo0937 family membrane protein [Ignavibacteriae bacterium]|nr:lmo0937 family membrane protein [Ignavibacteriota bacterium]